MNIKSRLDLFHNRSVKVYFKINGIRYVAESLNVISFIRRILRSLFSFKYTRTPQLWQEN